MISLERHMPLSEEQGVDHPNDSSTDTLAIASSMKATGLSYLTAALKGSFEPGAYRSRVDDDNHLATLSDSLETASSHTVHAALNPSSRIYDNLTNVSTHIDSPFPNQFCCPRMLLYQLCKP